jgi:hypothetical protein
MKIFTQLGRIADVAAFGRGMMITGYALAIDQFAHVQVCANGLFQAARR